MLKHPNSRTHLCRQKLSREFGRRLIHDKRASPWGATQLDLSTSELQPAALALYRNAGNELVREEVAETASNKTLGGGLKRFHFVKML